MSNRVNYIKTNIGYDLKIDLSDTTNWEELEYEIRNVSQLKSYFNSFSEEKECVFIFFSIWGGVDLSIFNLLIEQSQNYPDLNFFYRKTQYSAEIMNFFNGEININNSPVVFFSKNNILSGKIDKEKLVQNIKNLISN